MQNALTS